MIAFVRNFMYWRSRGYTVRAAWHWAGRTL